MPGFAQRQRRTTTKRIYRLRRLLASPSTLPQLLIDSSNPLNAPDLSTHASQMGSHLEKGKKSTTRKMGMEPTMTVVVSA
jgi:hypothetical protein